MLECHVLVVALRAWLVGRSYLPPAPCSMLLRFDRVLLQLRICCGAARPHNGKKMNSVFVTFLGMHGQGTFEQYITVSYAGNLSSLDADSHGMKEHYQDFAGELTHVK